MPQYQVENTLSRYVFGTYSAKSEADALDVYARDAGYEDFAAACEVAPVAEGEIVATLVKPVHVTRKERAAIQAYADGKPCRIRRGTDVHLFGRMPGTNAEGWYFAGYAEDILRNIAAEV
jgi:hypothetical protein